MAWSQFGKSRQPQRKQSTIGKRSHRNTSRAFETFETRLALTITAPVIIDNNLAGYQETDSLPIANLTPVNTSEITPAAVSDAAGNYHLVYAGGTAGSLHLMYMSRPAGGAWTAAVDLGGTDVETPRLDISSSGYLHVTYCDGNEIFYRNKSPAGVWTAALQLSVADGIESSNPDIVVDGVNSRIHVVWQDRAAGNLNIVARSYDTGAWQAQTTISTRADDDAAPRMALGADARVYVAWHNTASKEIYVRERSAAGVWAAITRADDTADQSLNPTIDVDSSNNLHVAWQDNASAVWDAAYAKRTGAVWSSVNRFTNPVVNDANVNVKVDAASKVYLSWTDGNNVWGTSNAGAGWSALQSVFSQVGASNNAMFIDPSINLPRYFAQAAQVGLTYSGGWDLFWNNEVPVASALTPVNLSNTASDETSPDITTDAAGNQYAVYQKGPAGASHLMYMSRAAGGSWSAATDLGGTDVKTPRLEMSSSGYLHVAYCDGNEIYYRSKSPAGVWTAATLMSVADGIESSNPDIAVDGTNSRIHLVWQDRAAGNFNISYRVYEAGVWAAATTISTRADDDLAPRVAFGDAGQGYVTWYNSASDEIYFRERSNAGVWAAIVRIDNTANISENPTISVGSGYVHIAWQENIAGEFQIGRSSRTPAGVWSTPMFFNTAGAAEKNVSIATLPGQFNIMSWADGENLYVVRSGGAGWGPVTKLVSNMGITNSAVEVNPFTGAIEILYQAKKTGITNGNSWDIYRISVSPQDALGEWITATGGYNNNQRQGSSIVGTHEADWTFTGLQDGIYTIEASWIANALNATDAQYSITVNGVTTTYDVNQQLAPLGTTVGGGVFKPLDSIYVTGGSLRVFLNDRANGRVVADAVRIVPPYVSVSSYGAGSRAVYPDAVSDATGAMYAVYAGGTDGNLHVQFVTKAAGSYVWSAATDLGGTNVNAPRITVDSSGNLHMVYSNANNVYYRKRTGAVWGAAVQLSDGTKSLEADVDVDSLGNVSTVWHCNGDGDYDIRYRRYDAASSTWLAEVALSSNGDLDGYPRLAVGSDNSVHVAWNRDPAGDTNDDIQYRKWTSGGGWGAVTRIDTGTVRSYNAMIALDSSNNPTIVWHEDVAGDWSIAVSRFNGASWSAPVFFNNPGVTDANATVDISPTGVVSIVWMNYSDFYIVRNDGPSGAWTTPRKIMEATSADGPASIVYDPTNGQLHVLAQFKNAGSWNIGYFYE